MPKGKILMGKDPKPKMERNPGNRKRALPVPYDTIRNADPVPYDTISNPDRNKKRPLPMPRPMPGDNKKRPLPMPRPIPGRKRPVPMPGDRTLPKRGGGAVPKRGGGIYDPSRKPLTPAEQEFLRKEKQLPRRGPVKPRTLEERKFIYDELRRNPRRGTPRGKGGISDPKRKSPTPDQMKEKQAMAKPKPKPPTRKVVVTRRGGR